MKFLNNYRINKQRYLKLRSKIINIFYSKNKPAYKNRISFKMISTIKNPTKTLILFKNKLTPSRILRTYNVNKIRTKTQINFKSENKF